LAVSPRASPVIDTVAREWEGGLLGELTSTSPFLYDAVGAAVVAEPYPLAERICRETDSDAHSRGSLLIGDDAIAWITARPSETRHARLKPRYEQNRRWS
jgi:hypothetical protein